MKALVCEMCSSSNLVKDGGYFVCQHCGTKYTVEEAKKMMIEGTVDVQGTVKLDKSSDVEKYLANARRAMQKEDWEETEKYYNLVEQNDPTNIEAIFYSAYGKAKASLSVNEVYKREAIFKALKNSVSILDDNYDFENPDQCNAIMERIVSDVLKLFSSSFVYTQTTNGYGVVSGDQAKTYTMFVGVAGELYNTLRNIAGKLQDSHKNERLFVLKLQLKVVDFLTSEFSHLDKASRITNAGLAKGLVAQIRKLEPSFTGRDYDARIKEIKKSGIGKAIVIALVCLVIVGLGVAIGLAGL